jgi:hypothetical protein
VHHLTISMRKDLTALMILTCSGLTYAQLSGWAPVDPGKSSMAEVGAAWILKNRAIQIQLSQGNDIKATAPGDPAGLNISDAFTLKFADGTELAHAGNRRETLPSPLAVKGGVGLVERFDLPAKDLSLRWELRLLDHRHYARESITIVAGKVDANIDRVYLGRGTASEAQVGTAQGSPLMAGNLFTGLEHPMSQTETSSSGNWSASIVRKIPLRAGQSITYSAVIGAAPEGQMRRAFLSYLEDQRPRRYEPFLHYNSWYDLGYFNRYTADECVERIHKFGDELEKKRGVKLRSFLFDDGWDNPNSLWNFNVNFPNGFTPLKEAAESYRAGPGVWLSPWGGYSEPREQRLKAGKAAGMEIDSEGYALSGPKYYALFHQKCLDFVQKYGVNQFKFDGTGSPDKQYPGSPFASDFEAAIQLIHDLRAAKPGLFINLTTGTWPSPFWTRFADSIWRGGYDHSFDGVGTWREKWMTYRDGDTYHEIVSAHSFYPLNSLMLHGLIFAKYAQHLGDDPGGDFRNEIRSYFGNGTQLQEMYITPDLLSKQNWDDLAQSAKWSYANKDVLIDSHWVGGDPSNLNVYGWASWSPRKSILVLRNPSNHAQAFSVDLTKVMELPKGTRGVWRAHSPYADDSSHYDIATGSSKVVMLQPFQVMVLEGAIR